MEIKQRKFTQGGYEDIYPEVVEEILLNPNPDTIAINAGLTENQWKCISHYLDNPSFSFITRNTGLARQNIYQSLSQGFSKLERARLERG